MAKFAPYLLIALVIGAFVFQNYRISSLSEKLGASTQEIETLTKKQEKFENDLKTYKEDRREYGNRISELEGKNRTKKTELDKLKGRESTLAAKPELTEKKINESFRQSADELSCSTGATERCVKR